MIKRLFNRSYSIRLIVAGFLTIPQSMAALNWAFDTYTGTGTNGYQILGSSGMNFQPDLVIIKGTGATPAFICSSTQTAGNSKAMDVAGAYANDAITGLLATGFQLGTNAGVNSNGSTYHFAAFETGADLVVGSYTGDGGFSKSISGLGFTPAFLIVFSNGSPSRPVWTNTQMEAIGFPGPAVAEFGVAQIWTGYVTSFDPTGFTVASFLDVSGTVYHYAAFKAVAGTLTTGSYAGTAGAKSPATGMAPQYVIACNGSVNGLSVQRLASNAVNESMDFTATASMTTEITAFNAGSYTAAAGSLQANNTGTTNYFVAIGAGQANPLPVELISFRAECDKPNNQLTWITASETNNDFFTIERTGDGEHYIPIGRIPGSGNSSSSHTYSLIDSFVPEGKLDYRLRQTDYNGEYRFPGVVESDDCNNPESEFSFRMYTGDDHQLNILFNLRADASYEFGLIDINGRSIRTGQLIASKGTNLFELNVEGYPAGLYLFRLTGSQNTITRKFYISR